MTRFWHHTLTALAANFGHEAEVETRVVCVDKWSKWRNVWHSAAIHSIIYMLGTPGRAVKPMFSHDRAVV